jgi:HEPN domain-containing protein
MESMTPEEKIQYWIEISEYDLETAKSLIQVKRYLYVGFMCHQSIEKILKGYYFKALQKTPPYSHNLSTLAEESGIYAEMSDEYKDFLDFLTPLNVKARYPAYKKKVLEILDENRCKEILIKTEELHLWIKKKLSIK